MSYEEIDEFFLFNESFPNLRQKGIQSKCLLVYRTWEFQFDMLLCLALQFWKKKSFLELKFD